MATTKTSIKISKIQYLELEKICIGAFSPLQGFMTEEQFLSVVRTLRLPDGSVFPLPILLDINQDVAHRIDHQKKVVLTYENIDVGILWPESFFSCNKKEACKEIYGTDDISHPGVSFFFGLDEIFVGGKVELIKKIDFDHFQYDMTPLETKTRFKELGWKKVVGFQTRNVPHRAHEYLQRVALEHTDGIFIQPLIGHKKTGDYTAEAVIKGNRALIENYFPKNRALLGSLSTLMRYAGPREAVFHAIIRRNYGCSHFIIGRDHAGVGAFYNLYDAQRLAESFDGELGIEIFSFKGPFYCSICEGITTDKTCGHESKDSRTELSGTMMREILSNGHTPPPEFMRNEVVNALKGVTCFID